MDTARSNIEDANKKWLSAASARGKVEATKLANEFASEEIEMKSLVDADSKEAMEKAPSAKKISFFFYILPW